MEGPLYLIFFVLSVLLTQSEASDDQHGGNPGGYPAGGYNLGNAQSQQYRPYSAPQQSRPQTSYAPQQWSQSKQPYQSQTYQSQTYQPQMYQTQPYQAQPYQAQPYQSQPYQAQPYQAQAYQSQPYQAQPYQPQPYQPPPPTEYCTQLPAYLVKQYYGRFYYFSWTDPAEDARQLSWSSARDFCSHHCMDLLVMESPEESDYIAAQIVSGDIYGAWTDGKHCPEGNCTSASSHQDSMSNWKWSSNMKPVSGEWSKSGGLNEPQPDNLVGRFNGNGANEECLAILNDWFGDGVALHDFMCRDPIPFICKAKPPQQYQQQPQYAAPIQGYSPYVPPYGDQANYAPKQGGYYHP